MVLIVSGGDPPPKRLLKSRAEAAGLVIAADRGGWYCWKAGILPCLLVGDIDSLPPAVLDDFTARGVEIVRLERDKDATDTQVALEEAIRRGAGRIEILGAIGTRFDHSLANVHLLALAQGAGVEACILSGRQRLFLIHGSYELRDARGCTISFLPLDSEVRGISLSGFVFELKDADMELGRPYGVSNVVKESVARICVRRGRLLAVVTAAGELA
ncbi:MAG TPA: thiamine diphosphokinase [Deltaproteobacteria bacterium]|nr:thiamine diphosphokinase [Deltaproteobacteria bacterium]